LQRYNIIRRPVPVSASTQNNQMDSGVYRRSRHPRNNDKE